MKTFCLGYEHQKCRTCQHEKNWATPNQMPDALRKSMQKKMRRIDDERCRLTKMGEYLPAPEANRAP